MESGENIVEIEKYIENTELLNKYEFHNYGHALEILYSAFPQEWHEIQNCLINFELTLSDIQVAGGNESPIPKKFDQYLYPCGWREIRISGDLVITQYIRQSSQRRKTKESDLSQEKKTINGYIDGHNIDFVKNKVAFDLEWNSKDQTFDRDLMAMRTYFDCGIIEVGILVTRAEELNEIFDKVADENGNILRRKYGASTTWMGKLTPRLDSRRNGGCPILAVGIRKGCFTDYGRLTSDN